jgi:hypothetical protein
LQINQSNQFLYSRMPAQSTTSSENRLPMTDERIVEAFSTAPPDIIAGLGRLPDDAKTLLAWQWANQPERRDSIEAAIREPSAPAILTPDSRTASDNHRNPLQRVREKAALNAIGKIPEYSGARANDAARRWLRDCENYFEKLERRSLEPVPDYEKVDSAEGRLTKKAAEYWRSYTLSVSEDRKESINTWQGFKDWIYSFFGENFSEHKRWERYDNLVQGSERVRDFAIKLQDAASLLEPAAPPPYMIRQRLLDGIPKKLLGRWTEERFKPTELQETIVRLSELEEGSIVRQSTDPDAMDLSAMTIRSLARNDKNRSTRPTRTASVRKCFRCGSLEHLIRDCPKDPSNEERTKRKSGKARGQ